MSGQTDATKDFLADQYAVPAGNLAWTLSGSPAVPLSVGSDGYVYGSTGLASRTLCRSGDGFASFEAGPTLPATAGHSIVFATRTAEGFFAITCTEELYGMSGNNSLWTNPAQFWFSPNFASGWTQVYTSGRVQRFTISEPVYSKKYGGTIILAGEYSQSSNQVHSLHMSRDGGRTWASIRAGTIINSAQNAHCHGSCYDAVSERIYLSMGDLANAWFGYSDDLGATWVPSPARDQAPFSTTAYHQPVLVHPLREGLITTPDSSTGFAGIWALDYRSLAEIPAYNTAEATSNQYGESPVFSENGLECYVLLPMRGTRVSNKRFVLGTGDGGKTWHKISDEAMNQQEYYYHGLVGPDRNGNVYMHGREVVSNADVNRLYVAKRINWIKRSRTYKPSLGGRLDNILESVGFVGTGYPIPFDARGGAWTVGAISCNTNNGTSVWGSATPGSSYNHDTPVGGASIIRQKINGNNLWELSATATFGQVEFTGPLTYIKFGANGGVMPSNSFTKLGFWGATPVAKPTGTPAAATDLATALTLLNDLRSKLMTIGLVG